MRMGCLILNRSHLNIKYDIAALIIFCTLLARIGYSLAALNFSTIVQATLGFQLSTSLSTGSHKSIIGDDLQ